MRRKSAAKAAGFGPIKIKVCTKLSEPSRKALLALASRPKDLAVHRKTQFALAEIRSIHPEAHHYSVGQWAQFVKQWESF